MNELDIIKHLAKGLDNRKYPFQIPRAFIYPGHECDYWTLTADGMAREYEIKVTRADFFNDAKKSKHTRPEAGANYFYYVVPTGLVTVQDIPPKYGLIEVDQQGSIWIRKAPTKLHKMPFDRWQMLAIKMYWKWYSLWREIYDAKKIDHDEWIEGLRNIGLNNFI